MPQISTSYEEAVTARPTNETRREVRVIRALFPRECLGPDSDTSSTCHNTGVQTLPPPNGAVYRIIHGREPSQTDYRRNMGAAAIGRYNGDPRSNPYELMYGASYTAPKVTKGARYVDSGFQTADNNITRKALAGAKVKASMTANKYRSAAAQAGYVVCAESRDDRIVHSEQHATTARLDVGGNLLDGNIGNRHLANMHGTLAIPFVSASKIRSRQEVGISHHDTTITYPSSSLSPLAPRKALPTPVTRISAFAPSSKRQPFNSGLAVENEYGNVGSAVNDFVVHDATATDVSSARRSTPISPDDQKVDNSEAEIPTKRRRCATPEAPQKSSISVTPPPSLSNQRSQQYHQADKTPPNPAESRSSRYETQERVLNVTRSTTTAKIGYTTDAYKPERQESRCTISSLTITARRDPLSPKFEVSGSSPESRKRPHDATCLQTSRSKLVTTRSHIREQISENNTGSDADEEKFQFVPGPTKEPHTNSRQQTPRATASDTVKDGTTTRPPRALRQALAPYVPPAMRARPRQTLINEQGERSRKR